MIGEVVGNYRIEEELSHGGMGALYLARHSLLGKQAAVKMLRSKFSADSEAVERFFQEAKATTRAQHPGIVDVYDFGYHKGAAYIVLELLRGETLGDRLRRDRKIPEELAMQIAWQIASALVAAHKNGVIHRDLKPDNIFLLPDEAAPGGQRVKVLDFGIAKLALPSGDLVETKAGEVLGTPMYMSPEQCHGFRDLDGRSDIYTLGALMFQMATGRPPFVHEGLVEMMTAHCQEAPPSPRAFAPELSTGFTHVILQALSKKRDQRQQSAGELAAALRRLAGDRVHTLPPLEETQSASGRPASVTDPVPADQLARGTAPPTGPGIDNAFSRAETDTAAEAAIIARSRRKRLIMAASAVLGLALAITLAVMATSGDSSDSAAGAPQDSATAADESAAAPDDTTTTNNTNRVDGVQKMDNAAGETRRVKGTGQPGDKPMGALSVDAVGGSGEAMGVSKTAEPVTDTDDSADDNDAPTSGSGSAKKPSKGSRSGDDKPKTGEPAKEHTWGGIPD